MPLPLGFGISSVNAGVAARRVVAPYGCHGPRRAGSPPWPPVPRCGTFPRSSRRILEQPRPACPDPHPLPRLVGTRRSGEMVQAGILHRIRARWPGRNEARNRILRAGNLAEGYRGIPRNRGVRGRTNWSRRELVSDGDVSLPRRSFGFFPIAGKETRPAGRNPVRRRAESSRPTGVTVHGRRAGQETRPYGEPLAFPRHGGRGKPLPYGWKGKHSATEDRRAATWGRPYDGISGRTQQNGAAHLKNPQKPLQLFPVLYSNISQKPGYVTIMTQYYGFVTLRPNPLTGGLH